MATSKTSSCQPPIPASPFPWFVIFDGEAQTFYDVEGNHCVIKKIPDMSNKFMSRSSHGWMVMSDLSSNTLFLLNPVSMEKIMLPPWDSYKETHFCILSLPPTHPKSIVAFIDSNRSHSYIVFCHPSENVWHEQEFLVEKYSIDDEDDDDEAKTDFIRKVVCCEGKIYGLVSLCNSVIELDVCDNHRLKTRQFRVNQDPLPYVVPNRSFFGERYLVESLGDIFFVATSCLQKNPRRLMKVRVYKLDFDKSKWTKVYNLGEDRVFFLSPGCCVSCSSNKSSTRIVKKNTIYFSCSENQEKDGRTSIWVYDMEENAVRTSLVSSNSVDDNTHQRWVMPNLQ